MPRTGFRLVQSQKTKHRRSVSTCFLNASKHNFPVFFQAFPHNLFCLIGGSKWFMVSVSISCMLYIHIPQKNNMEGSVISSQDISLKAWWKLVLISYLPGYNTDTLLSYIDSPSPIYSKLTSYFRNILIIILGGHWHSNFQSKHKL